MKKSLKSATASSGSAEVGEKNLPPLTLEIPQGVAEQLKALAASKADLRKKEEEIGQLTVQLDAIADKSIYQKLDTRLQDLRVDAKVLANQIRDQEKELQSRFRKWSRDFAPEARKRIPQLRVAFIEGLVKFRDAVFSENGYKGPSLFHLYVELEGICGECHQLYDNYQRAFEVLGEPYPGDVTPTPDVKTLRNFDFFLRKIMEHPAPSLVKVGDKVELVKWIGGFDVHTSEFSQGELKKLWEADEYNVLRRRILKLPEPYHFNSDPETDKALTASRHQNQELFELLIKSFRPITVIRK